MRRGKKQPQITMCIILDLGNFLDSFLYIGPGRGVHVARPHVRKAVLLALLYVLVHLRRHVGTRGVEPQVAHRALHGTALVRCN